MYKLPYARQWIDDKDIKAVCDVLHSDWLTSGPVVKNFEDTVASYCGVKHAIAVSNGTAALHCACLALGIKHGDVGITSPLSFLASANCIAYCGGRPDFVDIDPNTYCLSPEKLQAYIQEYGSPRVVIPVDFAGVPADLPKIRKLADAYGFHIIEDAAHAIGSTYSDGKNLCKCGSCTHTDMSILSFHPVKTITSGEGGMVLTNDDTLAKRVRMFANHGMERDSSLFSEWSIVNKTGEICETQDKADLNYYSQDAAPWLYQQQVLGYNYRITEIQSALGLSQFSRLNEFATRRREIVRKYNQAFGNHTLLITPPWPKVSQPAFHLYVLRLKTGTGEQRLELVQLLREKGIFSQIHYIPIYFQPWYRFQFGYEPGKCPETETVYSSCLSLPLFPAMSDDEVNFTIDTVIDAIEKIIK
jgi:perosamine synthetase